MGSSVRLSEPVILVKPSLSSLFAPRLALTRSTNTSHFQSHPRFIPISSSTRASSSSSSSYLNRRHFVSQTATLSISVATATGLYEQPAKSEEALSSWERVFVPVDPGVVLLDIAFVPDDFNHGKLSWRQKMVEKLGFHVQYNQLRRKISTIDLIPLVSRGRRAGFNV